jgi:hydrogenase expression/formation protein HypC
VCLGIPGQLVEIISADEHRAIAEVDGVRREINIALVTKHEGEVSVGEWVLIHVGFALSKIDEEEAARTLSFLKELGGAYEDEVDQFRETMPI